LQQPLDLSLVYTVRKLQDILARHYVALSAAADPVLEKQRREFVDMLFLSQAPEAKTGSGTWKRARSRQANARAGSPETPPSWWNS